MKHNITTIISLLMLGLTTPLLATEQQYTVHLKTEFHNEIEDHGITITATPKWYDVNNGSCFQQGGDCSVSPSSPSNVSFTIGSKHQENLYYTSTISNDEDYDIQSSITIQSYDQTTTYCTLTYTQYYYTTPTVIHVDGCSSKCVCNNKSHISSFIVTIPKDADN